MKHSSTSSAENTASPDWWSSRTEESWRRRQIIDRPTTPPNPHVFSLEAESIMDNLFARYGYSDVFDSTLNETVRWFIGDDENTTKRVMEEICDFYATRHEVERHVNALLFQYSPTNNQFLIKVIDHPNADEILA